MWEGRCGRVYGVGVEKCGERCGKVCWGVKEGEGKCGEGCWDVKGSKERCGKRCEREVLAVGV